MHQITKYSNLVNMKDEKVARNRHHARREALLGQIGGAGPFIEGSLCAVKRAGCAKPGWQLTWKQGGKTRTVYVPVELVPEVKAWTREYKRLKSLVRKVTGQSLALVRGHAARRAAANAGGNAGGNAGENAEDNSGASNHRRDVSGGKIDCYFFVRGIILNTW